MSDRVKLKGDVMWASTDIMNPMSEKYQIDICNLSDNAVNALDALGIPVNQKENQGYYVTCKSKLPIRTYDSDGQQLTGFPLKDDGSPSPQSVKIGNGSECIALIEPYSWKFKNKEGVSASLKKLVVTNLIKYGDDVGVDELLVEDDGEDEIL